MIYMEHMLGSHSLSQELAWNFLGQEIFLFPYFKNTYYGVKYKVWVLKTFQLKVISSLQKKVLRTRITIVFTPIVNIFLTCFICTWVSFHPLSSLPPSLSPSIYGYVYTHVHIHILYNIGSELFESYINHGPFPLKTPVCTA